MGKVLIILCFIFALISCENSTKVSSKFGSNRGKNAPSNLRIERVDSHTSQLTWVDNSEYESGFIIDKRTEDSDWILRYAIVDKNVTNYLDIIDGITELCYYRVCAYSADEFSLYSISSNYVYIKRPTSLRLKQENISTNVLLTWSDNSDNETGYMIERINTFTKKQEYFYQLPNTTSYIDTTTIMYEKYEHKVYAHIDNMYSHCINNHGGKIIRPYLYNCFSTNCVNNDFTIKDDYVYIAGNNGLSIINIESPSNPISVGVCEDIPTAIRIEVAGDYAFLIAENLKVIDISNPTQPVLVWSDTCEVECYDFCIQDDFLYLNTREGLRIYDINDAINLNLVSILYYYDSLNKIFVKDDIAYCSEVIDISDSAHPQIVNNAHNISFLSLAIIDSNHLISNWCQIYDISSPELPVLMSNINQVSGQVSIYNEYAFFTSSSRVEIVDVSDLNDLKEIGNHYNYDMNYKKSIPYKEYLYVLSDYSFAIIKSFEED